MNRHEAAAALAEVGRTEQRLAAHARWPFHRHAMFGLGEGLIVAGIAQPFAQMATMAAVALALFVVCVTEDRRRHGMFVSGWRPGATRPLTIALMLVLVPLLVGAAALRDGVNAQPLGYALGLLAAAICTAVSLRWEKIYRAELGGRR